MSRIDSSSWKPFSVDRLFDVLKVRNKLSKANIGAEDGIPVYSSESYNYGIAGYTSRQADYVVSEDVPVYVVFGDHTRTMNVVQRNFSVMDNVKVLVPCFSGINRLMFVLASWHKAIPNLGYARHWSFAKNVDVMLPSDKNGEPDWAFIDTFMDKVINQLKPYVQHVLGIRQHLSHIDSHTWRRYKIGGDSGLFEIEFCKCDHVGALLNGNIPYVGAAKVNNGVQKFVADEEPSLVTKGNCIVFICNGQGSCGYTLYEKDDFIGTKDVKVGRNEYLNELNGLFVVAALDKNRDIYGYGFIEKRSLTAMEAEEVVLPAKANGEPDWDYMETYMRNVINAELPYAEMISRFVNR